MEIYSVCNSFKPSLIEPEPPTLFQGIVTEYTSCGTLNK
jgi:hypothetical protein